MDMIDDIGCTWKGLGRDLGLYLLIISSSSPHHLLIISSLSPHKNMRRYRTMSSECIDMVATNRLPEIRNTVKMEIPVQLSGISSYTIT